MHYGLAFEVTGMFLALEFTVCLIFYLIKDLRDIHRQNRREKRLHRSFWREYENRKSNPPWTL